jgi:iron complex outermembrane receptor protein
MSLRTIRSFSVSHGGLLAQSLENARRVFPNLYAFHPDISNMEKIDKWENLFDIVFGRGIDSLWGDGMYKKVGAFTTLFVAIAAAMATSSASAEAAGAAMQGSQPAQDPSGVADQSTVAKKQADGSQSRSSATMLSTVVVTASRRSETLEKVPLAVSVVSNFDIQRKHLQNFSDYAADVPGLNVVSSQPGLTELSLRGISSGSGQPSASVGVYIDDTPFGSSSVFAGGAALTPDIDPSDLERLEVLSGPQGTLYGAGALGGVIRFITIAPDAENLSGRVQLGGSSVSGGGTGFDAHGMINLPLVMDKLALRVNVYDTTTPGFIDDAGLGKKDVNESRVKGSRASLLWTPTESTSLRLTAMAQNLSSDGTPTVALDPVTLKPVYGDLQQRDAAGSGTFAGQYRLYNATFNTDFGWAKLMSSSSYSTLDAVSNTDATALLDLGSLGLTLPNGQPYSTLEKQPVKQSKVTQEFRLSSPDSQRVTWLGGLFFTHEIGRVIQDISSGDYYGGGLSASPLGNPLEGTNQPSTYIAYAAYGSLTWHVSDRFDVQAGVRYSHDKQHYIEYLYGPLVGLAVPTVQVDKKSADSSTTYSLTPQFHINDNNLLYLRVATGFLPGGPNVVAPGTVGVPATFSPTKLTDYELGLKSTSWDDRLVANISAYYIDWTKIPLVTFENPYTFLTSAGQAKSKGLEASLAILPVKGLKFSVNASYNDAYLTKDAPAPSNGRSGDPLPYAPKFSLGLNGDYDFSMGESWRGYVGASFRHVGPRSTDYAFSYPIPGVLPTLPSSPRIPGYNTVDLRAGASYNQWNFDFYVKNLSNRRGIVQASSFQNYVAVAGATNPVTGVVEDNATIITPRLIGFSVSRSF